MNRFLYFVRRILLSIAIPGILFLVSYLVFPERVGLNLLLVLLVQAIPPAILAWGVCFEIKVKIWDFSVGSVVLISGILAGHLSNMLHLGLIGIVVLSPLVGMLGGLLTGTIFRYLKIPSIIVSVGMMLVYESISGLLFKGQGVIVSSDIYALASFPLNVIVGLAAFVLAYFLYNFRSFGYHVRAVGNGISIAKQNGISVDRIRVYCFAVTGLFAGIFAFMQLGGAGVMKAQSNMTTMGVVVDAIICACIALSLEKVANLIVGVFIGSVVTQIIKITVLISGFPSMFQQVVIAFFLLFFMGLSSRSGYIQSWWRRLRSRSDREEAPVRA